MAHIKSIKKIYSDGRHSAFTDMEYWKGHYYIGFRNAPGHARPGGYGKGMIIRSSDLETWEVCARFEMDGVDIGTPRLLNLGDGLGALCWGVHSKEPALLGVHEGVNGNQPHVRFTTDGTSWSSPQAILQRDTYFWRPVRFGDVCYMTVWGTEGLRLARSEDGRDWQIVSTIPPVSRIRYTEEGELWITEDERMLIIIRAHENPDPAYLAESEPPYTDWKLTELNYTVHCPAFKPVGDELWVAAKTITAQFPSSVKIPSEPSPEKIASLTRQDERLAKTPQDWHTAIWKLVGDHLEPILVLPSRGDCGYPGLVVDDRVLMSFYSQHDVDEGPKPRPGEHANEIYLAEIGL